jgi:hypothetical protein
MADNDDARAAAEVSAGAEETGQAIVSLAEFKSVDCEAPIVETRKVYASSLGPLYQKAAEVAKHSGNGVALRVYSLLSGVTQIHFKPNDRAEPFGPLVVMDGKRSVIPEDLRGEQSAVFAEIAATIKNPGLRARLADIAWYNDRKLSASAQLAISSYCDAVRLVMDSKAELFFDDEKATSHNAAEMLRRACQIANYTGWKDEPTAPLKTLIDRITQAAFDSGDANGYHTIGELNLDYEIVEAANVATQAEILAQTEGVHPETARHLWELAARAYRRSEFNDESNRCRIKAAECHVAMADAAGSGMAAASWLMDAIKALRQVPGTKVRRQELEAKLREVQASISDEMGVISTGIDVTSLADHARKSVGGLTVAQALLEFARLDASPAPAKLREEALAQASENPLSSIVPMAIYDDEGKLVAKSPGLGGGTEAEETAIRHLILRNEGFRRQIGAVGLLETARRFITSEHPLHTRDFLPLAELSPFVPAGRENIFALGFARFFGGDFVSALHILVPQLENSLRYVLKQSAIDPSSIQSDMTQESRTISVMLDKDRAALERIFGEAIVFEIENLFDFRGGPGLRHELAHGLLSFDASSGPDAIYACWFMFRLTCLPLFRHWQVVTNVYADRQGSKDAKTDLEPSLPAAQTSTSS